MNREIKFRGVNAVTGVMVFGQLIKTSDAYRTSEHGFTDCHIVDGDVDTDFFFSNSSRSIDANGVVVKPESVCQFTNQTDINNKEIYDQDIVKLTFENAAWDEPVVYNEVVRFHNGMWMAGDKPLYRDEYAPYTVEVVGNVFENEGLVKG